MEPVVNDKKIFFISSLTMESWTCTLVLLQISNGLIQYFKVDLACIEVGTDRGEDNAKGIAETILKHFEKKIKIH